MECFEVAISGMNIEHELIIYGKGKNHIFFLVSYNMCARGCFRVFLDDGPSISFCVGSFSFPIFNQYDWLYRYRFLIDEFIWVIFLFNQ